MGDLMGDLRGFAGVCITLLGWFWILFLVVSWIYLIADAISIDKSVIKVILESVAVVMFGLVGWLFVMLGRALRRGNKVIDSEQ